MLEGILQHILRPGSIRKEPTKIWPNVQTRGDEIFFSIISFTWEMLGRADFVLKENLVERINNLVETNKQTNKNPS